MFDHGYVYYREFGIIFFDYAAVDDFFVVALRNPIALISVLLYTFFIYNESPQSKLLLAIKYIAVPIGIVAAIAYIQSYLILSGGGKLIGQSECRLDNNFLKNENPIYGVTPIGTAGGYLIIYDYNSKIARAINEQNKIIISCQSK